jgi:hypothetical protein
MKLFHFYINSSVHVALAVVAFYVVTHLELNLAFSWDLAFFLFFASITGYNFVKYAGIAKLYHSRLTNNLRVIQLFSLVSLIVMLYFFLKLDKGLWGWIFILAVLNALYAIPVFKLGKNLRSIPLLKVFIIAMVWAVSTVFIPVKGSEDLMLKETTFVFYGLQRFFMVFCLMIPFEIRDVRFDAVSIQTLPQVLGIRNTKLMGFLLMLAGLFINYFILEPVHAMIYALIAFLLVWFILFSSTRQSRYFASFWVESIPIIYLLFNFIYLVFK